MGRSGAARLDSNEHEDRMEKDVCVRALKELKLQVTLLTGIAHHEKREGHEGFGMVLTVRFVFCTTFAVCSPLCCRGVRDGSAFGLTGHQLLGVAWANKPFTLLPEDKRTILGNILVGTPLKTTSNN